MRTYQQHFIEFALDCGALCFGDFTLKSGRKSPYFYNARLFNTGERLARLGMFYAEAIVHSGLDVDILFGPAYAGIPIVCATAMALSIQFGQNIPYCFNRKEVKEHGEGGQLVGSALQGQVMVVDDVITAGTAFRESQTLIEQYQAQVAALVVSLDRQEPGADQRTAIAAIEQDLTIPVVRIITVSDVITYLKQHQQLAQAEIIASHLAQCDCD